MNSFDKFFIHFCVATSIIRSGVFLCEKTNNNILITIYCFATILGCLIWIETINKGIICKKD